MNQPEIPLENTFDIEQAALGKVLWGEPLFESSPNNQLRQKPIEEVPDFSSLVINGQARGRLTSSRSMEASVRTFVLTHGWKIHVDEVQYWDKRGIDLIAYKNRTVMLIQCKLRHRGFYLTLPIIVKLLGSITIFKEEKQERLRAYDTAVFGVLIGTAPLSPAADKLARQHNLKFFNLALTERRGRTREKASGSVKHS